VDSNHVEAWTTSAWLYDDLGRREEAVEAHRKVVALRRTPVALRGLARALHAVDLHDEGAATAHDALMLESAPRRRAIGPTNGDGAFGLVARLLLERGQLEGLRRYYLQRGSSLPTARDFWWSMATALTERGRYEHAVQLLDHLVDEANDESFLGARLYRDRAILLEVLGRGEEARTAWEMMRMHRDFARFERSGVGALDVGPDGAANLEWETTTASIADPWTDRVRPFQRPQGDA
jgi:tetratricopeptide (TPR) repeat protein